MKKRQLKSLLIVVWSVNVLICLGVVALLIWSRQANQTVIAPSSTWTLTPSPKFSSTPEPSVTPIPPPTRRPTITLWPTPSRGPSVTPMTQRPPNVIVIGYSVEQRGIEAYKFGSGPNNKLIVAGIHGGYERNTVFLAEELIEFLDQHPELVPSDTTLYIVKSLNPDGFARATNADGRANSHNVDLNHNWPYNWAPDWSRDGCFNERILTAGSSPGSEPETQTLMKFIGQIYPKAIISYHSAALGIFPGGVPDFPASERLAEAVAEVTNYPYPPIHTGCDYTGNLTDWAASEKNIPAIDIELTNHRDTDFDQNLRVLQVFLGWKK